MPQKRLTVVRIRRAPTAWRTATATSWSTAAATHATDDDVGVQVEAISQPGESGRGGPVDETAERARARIADRIAAVVRERLSRTLPPGLHLVATPIGNLGDVTLRALVVIAGADHVFCEDTRVSRRLLDHFAIQRPLTAYHDHNASRLRPRIVDRLADGAAVALISDAGSPLIADPGYKLVREAAAAGHSVWIVPGPSSIIAGLSVSGLPTDQFLFAGFLPPKSKARRSALRNLAAIEATLVFLETAPRLGAAIDDIEAELGNREIAVARELTKLHETVLRGRCQDVRQAMAALPEKGEIVLTVAGRPPEAACDDATITHHLLARGHLRPSQAIREVAEALGVGRKRVYALFLGLDGRQSDAAAGAMDDEHDNRDDAVADNGEPA